jgi:hypothetical protein
MMENSPIGGNMEQIRSKQFSLGDIFSTGWRIYWKNFWTILLVVLSLHLPINLIDAGTRSSYFLDHFGMTGFRIFYTVLRLLAMFIDLIVVIAIVGVVESSIRGQAFSWKDSMKLGLKIFFQGFWY